MRFEVAMRLVIVLLLVVLPLILQIIAKIRGLDNAPPPGGPPRPQPRPPQTPLEDEISEFLRRASEGRRPPGSGPPSRSASVAATMRSAPAPARRPTAPPVAAEVVPPPVGGDISRHVQKFLDSGEFQRRSSEMGEGVVASDKAMDQRSSAFDRPMGQLGEPGGTRDAGGAGPQVTAEAVSPMVADLVSALCRPDTVRQAIIINEILRRPEDRWES